MNKEKPQNESAFSNVTIISIARLLLPLIQNHYYKNKCKDDCINSIGDLEYIKVKVKP